MADERMGEQKSFTPQEPKMQKEKTSDSAIAGNWKSRSAS
jgi:hypothetical protein